MAGGGGRRSKYGNTPVEVAGFRFDSKREAERWRELCLLEAAGQIADLRRQVRYRIEINCVTVTTYVADFVYRDVATNETVVEDAKGYRTDVYKLKQKLMRAVHGIEIREV